MTQVLNTRKPNPGTREAGEAGCTCPVMDNSYGKGYMGQEGVFVYTMSCPIHTANLTIDKDGMQIGREESVQKIKNATKLFGYEIVITDHPFNADEVKHFERGREWTKERILSALNPTGEEK